MGTRAGPRSTGRPLDRKTLFHLDQDEQRSVRRRGARWSRDVAPDTRDEGWRFRHPRRGRR
ncbi:hypothetical protein GGQ91_004851 [Methylobacterium fujisawaense]|uniref:Uncharacterized protein n=1 Tax=Methylobacterium fujisawaense TaxID=107400 RepID=A0ABR6DH54_9HYPH|nr:hypothetical protein [Methylobacterium fujisawaense]